MNKRIRLSVSPETAANEQFLKKDVAVALEIPESESFNLKIVKRSVDARSKKIKINLEILVFKEIAPGENNFKPNYKDVDCHKKVAIIGSGPAGLFSALKLLEHGIKPVIFERGKDVRERRRDLAKLSKHHLVNSESNYCFGEGGAGTYSDGKLYTRSSKRGDIHKILQTFVYHGASPEICVDAHPHIGTNKLPDIIKNIRDTIIKFGGEIHFNSKLTDIFLQQNRIHEIEIENLENQTTYREPFDHLILATGHSARDIFELLRKKNILIEAKPFALGVRIEHPQELIDKVQYHCSTSKDVSYIRNYLPAASYSLVHQTSSHGVYSFCMCPGGIIAPCATAQEEIVTNGWSPSKRNNPYANSGLVVGLGIKDFEKYKDAGALSGLRTQQAIERKAWLAGGKKQSAPAQRVMDFLENKISTSLPACSYHPGIVSYDVKEVLGNTVSNAIREGLLAFGKKMRGYLTNEAVLVATESRTSTPVRIPRNPETGEHVQTKGLYPCGEGAGYAGGIVSAAMDGENIAGKIAEILR